MTDSMIEELFEKLIATYKDISLIANPVHEPRLFKYQLRMLEQADRWASVPAKVGAQATDY